MTSPDAPQKMKYQDAANRLVRGVLATPVLHTLVSGRLLTLYIVGRRTGRLYTLPVAYTRVGDALLIGTHFPWRKNLETGTPIEIRLRRHRQTADVEAFTDEADVVAHYGEICHGQPQFAKMNNVTIHPDGTPDADDLHRLYAVGARSFRLNPR
ncbi:hypothetical protein VZC37_20970 [Gordonia sp. LSe1-13]|uniref:DUF385 domain-containing protein n=1 Tax=Gordonia sesuvii TaxID=3116777 RepID=A0ABU7MI80_9ACTN|nr:hypothetical protein [Gordonia sp. LSe1-13]